MNQNWEHQAWFASTSSSQTMKTWARLIDAKEDFPPAFASDPVFIAASYRIYLPLDERESVNRPEGAICLSPQGVDVFSIEDGKKEHLHFNFTDIMWIEEGGVLLHGWIAFRDPDKSYLTFFNTANRAIFMPLMWSLRCRSFSMEMPKELELSKTPQAVLDLEGKDFTLMSICRNVLVSDMNISEVYYQDPLDDRGPFAVLITKKELIFCRHVMSSEMLGRLDGRSCLHIPLPSKDSFTLVKRERRDVLYMPLMPEGTGGSFSFPKTGTRFEKFIKSLRDCITING